MKVYATVVAFYLPLIVIIILNTQIYIIARGIINREKKSPNVSRHFLVVNPSQISAKTINACTVKLVPAPDNSEKTRDQSTEDFTTVTSTPGLSEYEKGQKTLAIVINIWLLTLALIVLLHKIRIA